MKMNPSDPIKGARGRGPYSFADEGPLHLSDIPIPFRWIRDAPWFGASFPAYTGAVRRARHGSGDTAHPVIKWIEATHVKVDDDMNVFLAMAFESEDGERVCLQRAYRFDSDHVCMGPIFFWHHRGQWSAPDYVQWGGSGRLRSLVLKRDWIQMRLDDTEEPHPEGWSVLEVAFDVGQTRFGALRKAMHRCFEGMDGFVEKFS